MQTAVPWGKPHLNTGRNNCEKRLFAQLLFWLLPLLAHADLQTMDDGALSGDDRPGRRQHFRYFQGSVGAVTYTDTDTNGGSCDWEHQPAGADHRR